MSRWMIEKSGTGIEKSGTGIEKSGTGIEKSGTGIEKSGTGIEKSGTGIRKGLVALSLTAIVLATSANAGRVNPNGELSITVDKGVVTASWSIDGSLFAGIATTRGSSAFISLTEISLAQPVYNTEIVGGGTGKDIVGGGTGAHIVGGGTGKNIVGGGTGAHIVGGGTGAQIVGGGTGAQIVGGGTGAQIVGGGTGARIVGGGTGADIVGGGTGADIVGGGTGSRTLIVGGGTGADAVAITLPGNEGLQMEISLACDSATVYVLDSAGYEVVTFENVKFKGDAGLCGDADTFAPVQLPGNDANFDRGDSRGYDRKQ